jgi:hypothetical protein
MVLTLQLATVKPSVGSAPWRPARPGGATDETPIGWVVQAIRDVLRYRWKPPPCCAEEVDRRCDCE